MFLPWFKPVCTWICQIWSFIFQLDKSVLYLFLTGQICARFKMEKSLEFIPYCYGIQQNEKVEFNIISYPINHYLMKSLLHQFWHLVYKWTTVLARPAQTRPSSLIYWFHFMSSLSRSWSRVLLGYLVICLILLFLFFTSLLKSIFQKVLCIVFKQHICNVC